MSGPVKIPRVWREAGEIGPACVRKDATRAQFKNGILEITLPKQTAALPRSIPIQV